MKTTHKQTRLPALCALAAVVKATKQHIADDYLAFEGDSLPGIQLTVGINEGGEWDWQTGDNSYSGPVYFYPHWAVVGVYRRSNSKEVARDIQSQLADLLA